MQQNQKSQRSKSSLFLQPQKYGSVGKAQFYSSTKINSSESNEVSTNINSPYNGLPLIKTSKKSNALSSFLQLMNTNKSSRGNNLFSNNIISSTSVITEERKPGRLVPFSEQRQQRDVQLCADFDNMMRQDHFRNQFRRAATDLNMKLEDVADDKRLSPYKQKIVGKTFEEHDIHGNFTIQKEALNLYMRKKKLQAIKAIQYVMREKPTVFVKNSELGKSPNEKNTNDNVSEIGSELNRSYKKPKLSMLKQDSFQSYNDVTKPTKTFGQRQSVQPQKQQAIQGRSRNMSFSMASQEDMSPTRRPSDPPAIFLANQILCEQESLQTNQGFKKVGKAQFGITKQRPSYQTPQPQKYSVLSQSQRINIKMQRARENLENQAAKLINKFEDKLRLNEVKAKKIKEKQDERHYERLESAQKMRSRIQSTLGKNSQFEKDREKRSLASYRSNLSEHSERQKKKIETDKLKSQEHQHSFIQSRTQSARDLHQTNENNKIRASLNSYETRIQDHRDLLMSNRFRIQKDRHLYNQSLLNIKQNYDIASQERVKSALYTTLQKHLKQEKQVGSAKKNLFYKLEVMKDKRYSKLDKVLQNTQELRKQQRTVAARMPKDKQEVSETLKSQRSHSSLLQREVNRLIHGEVRVKKDILKQQRDESNQKIMSRQAKIEEQRIAMKSLTQGMQGQQLMQDKLCFTGPQRQKLNVENPLLQEISLVYLGLKKVKPHPISQRLGNTMLQQITKKK